MRGIPDLNYPAFDDAAGKLRAAGYDVFNPADYDRATGLNPADLDIRQCMAVDLGWICRKAEGIALLPGWGRSDGAHAEVALAIAIGIPYSAVDWWLNGGKHFDD